MQDTQIKTGEPAPKAGKYRSDTGKEVDLQEGERAPIGDNGQETTYNLIKEA
jgi:hypothetical protein